MRKDGFTVISEVCSFYRKLLLVTWPCLHATRLRFLWKFWRIWCRLQPLSTSSECQCRFKMTSLVDLEAHLRKRADEMAMSERGVRAMIDKGITTLGKLAFAHGQPGVPIVSAEFDTFSQDVLGAMASIGDRAVLKRLLFEGHTFVISQLKEQVTNPEAAQTRKIPQVERDARMEELKRRLPGILIERQMSPSHALLDLCAQQHEARQLKYLSPDKCTSREWEVSMSKSAKQIEIDADKLVVKEKAEQIAPLLERWRLSKH